MSEKYKSFVCFSGADVVICINDKVYGEIVDTNIDTKTKELTVKTVLFNTLVDTHKELIAINNSKILILFCNEYGDKMYRVFNGVNFSHENIKYSIDKSSIYNSFVFTFEDSTSYENCSVSIGELRKNVFNE